jgi:hypothetical protein
MTLEIQEEGVIDPSGIVLSSYFRPDGLFLPENLSKEEFFEVLYKAKLCKKFGSHWVRQAIEYGLNAYDKDFVHDTEDQVDKKIAKQFELFRGFPEIDEKPKLNEGLGKGTAIVTIEGIRQSFDIWRRKVAVDKWNTNDCKKACELLRPMVEFYDHLLAEAAK